MAITLKAFRISSVSNALYINSFFHPKSNMRQYFFFLLLFLLLVGRTSLLIYVISTAIYDIDSYATKPIIIQIFWCYRITTTSTRYAKMKTEKERANDSGWVMEWGKIVQKMWDENLLGKHYTSEITYANAQTTCILIHSNRRASIQFCDALKKMCYVVCICSAHSFQLMT